MLHNEGLVRLRMRVHKLRHTPFEILFTFALHHDGQQGARWASQWRGRGGVGGGGGGVRRGQDETVGSGWHN